MEAIGAFTVIPAIDLVGGRVVRLQQGNFDRATIYSDDPVAVAIRFAEAGASHLHVVDLDAARDAPSANAEVIEAIVRGSGLSVQVGGGIRTEEAALAWLDRGVARVVVGTMAVERPEAARALAELRPGAVLVGLDTRAGRLATHGWSSSTAATSAGVAAEFDDAPIAGFVYTEIARDGMSMGPDLAGLRSAVGATRHPVTASGGVGSQADLRAVREAGAAAAIVGRALYDGSLTIEDALIA